MSHAIASIRALDRAVSAAKSGYSAAATPEAKASPAPSPQDCVAITRTACALPGFSYVTMENCAGREVATAPAVPNGELTGCVKKFFEHADGASVVFVNGRGYTSLSQFLEMKKAVNEFSTKHGGTAVYG